MPNTNKDCSLGQLLDWQTMTSLRPPILQPDELHIWCIPLSLGEKEQSTALQLLSDIQRDKFHRRTTDQLRNAYVAGRYYLSQLLAAYIGIDAVQVQLAYSRLNKPYLDPNPSCLEFNFTDTSYGEKSIGLFAFTKQRQVGVDIEALSRDASFAAIAEKRFSLAELDYASDGVGGIDPHRFLCIWTRKEAFGKAIGKGINFRMRDLELASGGEFVLNFHSDDSSNTAYRLHQIRINKQLIASVVHEGHQPLAIKAFRSTNHFP